MSLDDEILARIRAVQAVDNTAKLEDFQLRVAANGSVLVNLTTRRAYLIYDEFSELVELHDWEELFQPDSASPPADSKSNPSSSDETG